MAAPPHDPFFATIPDALKLRRADGRVVADSAILLDFASTHGIDVDALWKAVRGLPRHDKGAALTKDSAPAWLPGEHAALQYRGSPIGRDKMWFQRDVHEGLLRYGYTGWQWKVAHATYELSTVPALAAACDTVAGALALREPHNHWIVTQYETGADSIGLHSDKTADWAADSTFCVLKLGAPRPFVFVDGEVEVYNETLPAGAAIVLGMEANSYLKHAVPKVATACDPSGSIVGRCITTRIPWATVDQRLKERAAAAAAAPAPVAGRKRKYELAADA